ncbi:general substrate transporter [Lentinula edodes]|nr:general substrate transporter [Lentinula edodes]
MTFRSEVREFVHYRNAYLLALSAAMGSIFYGWDIGLIGGIIAMSSFQSSFGVNKLSTSAKADFNGNIVSILQGGCFFGALSMGYFSGKFGRKPCLIASGVIYIIGSTIQSIAGLGSSAATGLSVLYFSRFLGGIGVGMVSALVPSYVSECTPRKIRGRCTGMIQLANNVGIMLSFWVNYSAVLNLAPTDMQWRIPFIVQIIPGALFIIGMLFQPESPRWLVEKGRYAQAAQTLAYVARVTPEDPAVLVTLDEIKEEFEGRDKLTLWQQFKGMGASRAIAIRCFIPSLVMFFQQWTGTNAINYFSPEIFTGLGITGTSSTLFATGIYGVVKVISVGLVLMFAVESFGRKRCLIVGGIGQGLMMLWIAGYSAIHPSGGVVPASYVSLVAVYLYAVFYCVGWGPVPWVISAEVAPNHLRTVSLSVAIGINWLFSFTISKITPIMLNNITYGTFLIFGLMCIIMAGWAYVFFPETAGFALEDIHFLFENDVIVRALQDAPLGRLFIGKKSALPVEELRKRETEIDQRSIKEDDAKASDDAPSKTLKKAREGRSSTRA